MRHNKMLILILSSIFVLSCTQTNSDSTSESSTAPDLASYLEEHPALKASLNIEQTYSAASYYYSGSLLETSYDDWSDEDKEALRAAFVRAWFNLYDSPNPNNLGESDFAMPVACTDCATELVANPNAKPLHKVTEAVGKSVYLAYAAQSLALEIGEGLSWSLAAADSTELHHYFNSRSLMHRLGFNNTDFFVGSWTVSPSIPEKYLGDSSPATPIYSYNFLVNNSILASTQEQTVYNLADWFRFNGVHFYFGYERQNAYDHWQFAGQVPASRVIDGTVRAGESSARHWTAGCHGTAGFFKNVLKSINIPMEILLVCGHAVMHFPTLGLYMDHGDNPYNLQVRSQPEKNISGIFIDQATFEARFGVNPHLTPGGDPICANIGKAGADF